MGVGYILYVTAPCEGCCSSPDLGAPFRSAPFCFDSPTQFWYSFPAMLKIRLQRIGRKNDPSYRVVVAEHARGPKSGNFVERVGVYNPNTKERAFNKERILYWMSVGAKASGTVHNMLVSEGIVAGEKVNVLPKKTPIAKEKGADESAAVNVMEEDQKEDGAAEPLMDEETKEEPQSSAAVDEAKENGGGSAAEGASDEERKEP